MSDSEHTEVVRKKTSRFALTTLYLSIVAFLAGITFSYCDSMYWNSLTTNHLAGTLMSILGPSWYVLSLTVFLLCFISLVWILCSGGQLKGVSIIIVAVVIVAVGNSVAMPCLGSSGYVRHRSIANEFATQTFTQANNNFSLDHYIIESQHSVPRQEPRIVEVKYTLKETYSPSSSHKEFMVLLNFDTGEKTIVEKSE